MGTDGEGSGRDLMLPTKIVQLVISMYGIKLKHPFLIN